MRSNLIRICGLHKFIFAVCENLRSASIEYLRATSVIRGGEARRLAWSWCLGELLVELDLLADSSQGLALVPVVLSKEITVRISSAIRLQAPEFFKPSGLHAFSSLVASL